MNRLLKSIQLQKLISSPNYNNILLSNNIYLRIKVKEIEIIFIEDCSTDKGFQLLKEYSKIDQRIVLIKNEKNKGCLYSYVKGILETKENLQWL